MFSTVDLRSNQLIQPYFVYEDLQESQELSSIFGQKKHTLESLKQEIELGLKAGVTTPLLFFIPKNKQVDNFSYQFDTKVLSEVKKTFADDITLMTDMCLCSQTESGHCAVFDQNDKIDNHATVMELVKKSIAYAQAGSDAICPSDMMDNRIGAIRTSLNKEGCEETLVMSYSTKFSSNLYGPFREAAESAPSKGNRKSYQIDYRNESDAIRSSLRDMEQGADILMVKPAGFYLDIISRIKNHPQMNHMPLAAYQVSGEYQSLYLMSQHKLISFDDGYLESLYAIKRSGADMIITYGANKFNSIMGRKNG